MKKRNREALAAAQQAELEALAALPDDRIDTSGMPEVRDRSDAKRGLFHRPVKQQLTLRLDADLVAWFKQHAANGQGYQPDINRALRDHVQRSQRARRAVQQPMPTSSAVN